VTGETGLEPYFREAVSWDADRTAQARRTAHIAWCVAGAGWLCAVASAASLALLMPLKRVEPFVVRVDNSTGVVDVVPVYSGTVAPDQAVTRYFLTHYVSVCERFNLYMAESDYQECGALQSAQRNQSWYALWTPSNPASPLNIHKDGSVVRVQVAAVSFLARANGEADLAQVRYLRAERSGGGSAERVSHWIATIQYAYVRPASDPRMRQWNPLGFQVLEVSSEPEIVTPSGGTTP